MITEDDLTFGSLRLLEVDNRVILPVKTGVRLLITASDVLHSWAVPSLGVKMDACPGRLNQVSLYINKLGIFYGQCSELCGINHAFMPIALEARNLAEYVLVIGVYLNDYKSWRFSIKADGPLRSFCCLKLFNCCYEIR